MLKTMRWERRAWVQASKPPSGGGPGSRVEVREMVLERTFDRTPSWEDSIFSIPCSSAVSSLLRVSLDDSFCGD